MKRGISLSVSTCLIALAAVGGGTRVVSAEQQLWASQYVNWTFDKSVNEVWNFDQQVWFPQPGNSSFWPIQWDFNGADFGGYMGLQQQASAGDQNVRFSIWNATSAQGPNCKPFDGEGIGQTCTLAAKIDTKKFYRLRLWRLAKEQNGQWWGGWLIEADAKGTLTENFIGRIKAPATATTIDPHSISNFVEYFGDSFKKCERVPLSIVGFTPPAVNYNKATGSYQAHAKYGGSQRAEGNSCSVGQQSKGAFISAKPYEFGFAKGVMMFLGSTLGQHVLDKNTHPTPTGMPVN
jgi:hypothetical protein